MLLCWIAQRSTDPAETRAKSEPAKKIELHASQRLQPPTLFLSLICCHCQALCKCYAECISVFFVSVLRDESPKLPQAQNYADCV